ncbi:MAG: rhodanese-like domain-containing protein [Pseudomonadota bacterium]
MQHLSAEQAAAALKQGEALVLDVREDWELAIAAVPNATHIPMNQIPNRLEELDPNQTILVLCHSGVRSQSVTNYLMGMGYQDVHNIVGGISEWSKTVDSRIPIY